MKRFSLMIAIAAGVALFGWSRPRTVPPAPEREVKLEQLVRQGDRMYFMGDMEPFSGVVLERYSSRQLKARSQFSRGFLHGVSEGWHTNGAIQIQEHFQDGVSHGLRTKWFASGQKMSEAQIEHGQVVGAFRRWHENGALAELLTLTNGSPEGVSWSFYPSGYAQASAVHGNGLLLRREFWKDGERKLAGMELNAPTGHGL